MNQEYDSEQPCFIDSNIWLYVFMQRQDSAKSAIAKSIIQHNNVVISTQVINEVCANLLKKTSSSEME
jgi:predicted nucleic acid-binding protein